MIRDASETLFLSCIPLVKLVKREAKISIGNDKTDHAMEKEIFQTDSEIAEDILSRSQK